MNSKEISKNKYECVNCKAHFEVLPGPVICPECEHLYLKWLNYSEELILKRRNLPRP